MRKIVNVLWLDDNASNSMSMVQNSFIICLRERGYESNIIPFKSFDEAKTRIESKEQRIDFVISDYNLGLGKTGLDFLIDIRKAKHYKQFFLLYSGTNKESIRSNIINKIQEDKYNVDYLSNYFYYSSLDYSSKADYVKLYSFVIDMALSRWNELSALRGEFATINSLAESIVRKIVSIVTPANPTNQQQSDNEDSYYNNIETLKFYTSTGLLATSMSDSFLCSLYSAWHTSRMIRNALEHKNENWDSTKQDFYITDSNTQITIYENDISKTRKSLMNTSRDLKKLFDDLFNCNDNLSHLLNDEDFVNL